MIRDQINKYKMIYLQRGGASAKQESMVRNTFKKTLESQIRFNHCSQAMPAQNKQMVDLEMAFVWSPMETAYERPGGELLEDRIAMGSDGKTRKFEGFTERNLQLGFQRHLVWKHRALINLIYQRITLSEHALYRMVDRGVCDKAPLAHFSNRIEEWLPYINALMLAGCNGGFVPFADGGLVIQTYAVIEPDEAENNSFGIYDRFSMTADRQGIHLDMLEPKSIVDRKHPTDPNRRAWMDYRITTYLTDHQFCSSRIWAKMEFQKIKEQFPAEWAALPKLNTMMDVDDDAAKLLSDKHSDFRRAMKKLISNHRFQEACRRAYNG